MYGRVKNVVLASSANKNLSTSVNRSSYFHRPPQEDPGTYTVVHTDKPHRDITERLTRKTKSRSEPATYQLEPSKRLNRKQIEKCMYECIDQNLPELKYEPALVVYTSKCIAEQIKKRVKEMNYERYKLVVLVWIGELCGQGLQIGTRSLWDVTADQCLSVTRSNNSMYCMATVYAIYQE